MSIISEELYLFSEELQTVLYPTVLQELAKQVGFVQRLRPCLNSNEFVF